MFLTLKKGTTEEGIKHIIDKIKEFGFEPHISEGATATIIGVIGENVLQKKEIFESMFMVESVTQISKPYKLVSKEFHYKKKIIKLNYGIEIGGEHLAIMGGPCSIDTLDFLYGTAKISKKFGVNILRGGAFKPRTSPYAFQGLGEDGLKMLKEVGDAIKIPTVTEAMTLPQANLVAKYSDIIQIGARNSQNFDLLREVGRIKKPVLLKRGMSMTISEFLMSAEYIASEGNYDIILCERGIRTFETSTRFTLDLNAVPVLNSLTNLPIIVDASHGTGIRKFVQPMSMAGIAAGADGLVLEIHPNPEIALSDGSQTLYDSQVEDFMAGIRKIAIAMNRNV